MDAVTIVHTDISRYRFSLVFIDENVIFNETRSVNKIFIKIHTLSRPL